MKSWSPNQTLRKITDTILTLPLTSYGIVGEEEEKAERVGRNGAARAAGGGVSRRRKLSWRWAMTLNGTFFF